MKPGVGSWPDARQSPRDRGNRRPAVAGPAAGLHRPGRAAQAPGRRAGDLLCRLRPDRRRACRSGTWCRCSPPAGSSWPGTARCCSSAAPPGLIGDPQGGGRAGAQRARGRGRLGGADPRASSSRSSTSPATTRPTLVNNLDWTAPHVGDRVPARRRQALPGQPDARPRDRPGPARERASASPSSATSCCRPHDYFQLHQRYGCTLQLGGSDQWGNITAGVDYIRRRGARGRARLLDAAGHQGGRHEVRQERGRHALWLDPAMTARTRSTSSGSTPTTRDVVNYLKVLQLPPRTRRSTSWSKPPPSGRPPGSAQRALAEELTTLVHGEAECAQVVAASQALFGRGSLADLAAPTLRAALAEAGLVTVTGELPPVAALLKESGAGGQHERGPPHDRRGRRVRQQRAGDRRRGHGRSRRRCCTGGTWCCAAVGEASPAIELTR